MWRLTKQPLSYSLEILEKSDIKQHRAENKLTGNIGRVPLHFQHSRWFPPSLMWRNRWINCPLKQNCYFLQRTSVDFYEICQKARIKTLTIFSVRHIDASPVVHHLTSPPLGMQGKETYARGWCEKWFRSLWGLLNLPLFQNDIAKNVI